MAEESAGGMSPFGISWDEHVRRRGAVTADPRFLAEGVLNPGNRWFEYCRHKRKRHLKRYPFPHPGTVPFGTPIFVYEEGGVGMFVTVEEAMAAGGLPEPGALPWRK